jgi:hypothetical protein
VLELVPVRVSVVTCVADAGAVDRAAAAWPALVLRVAPDEALLVDEDPALEAALNDVRAAARGVDEDALVVDVTDGWMLWRIRGDAADDAFARISQMPAPQGFAQGEVAHVPAKVVADDRGILLLVPAMWREAVRESVLAECTDLGITEGTTAPTEAGA